VSHSFGKTLSTAHFIWLVGSIHRSGIVLNVMKLRHLHERFTRFIFRHELPFFSAKVHDPLPACLPLPR
jgi:hypothetical protein